MPGRWCFTEGCLKDQDIYSEQGWYSTLEGFDGLMETRNTRASLSLLHSEVEALIWAMECRMRNLRQFQIIFVTNCSKLVKIASGPKE